MGGNVLVFFLELRNKKTEAFDFGKVIKNDKIRKLIH